MEIEKLIDSLKKCANHHMCVDCLFASDNGNCIDAIMRNAATALEQVQSENDRLNREGDAAVGDLETIMAYGGGNLDTCQFCKNSQCYARGGTKLCIPEWRG